LRGQSRRAVATIRDDDSVINFNFRADRARQITRCLARESGLTAQGGRDLATPKPWTRPFRAAAFPRILHYVCMTQYDQKFTLPFVVQPDSLKTFLPT